MNKERFKKVNIFSQSVTPEFLKGLIECRKEFRLKNNVNVFFLLNLKLQRGTDDGGLG